MCLIEQNMKRRVNVLHCSEKIFKIFNESEMTEGLQFAENCTWHRTEQ